MRVEIRKSGGPACETCGATELVMVPRGSPLERDIHELLAEETRKLELDVLAVFETAVGELRETARVHRDAMIDRVEDSIEACRTGLLATFTERHEELADGVLAFMDNQHVPRYRLAKKRWHRRLQAELELAVGELQAQTRLV